MGVIISDHIEEILEMTFPFEVKKCMEKELSIVSFSKGQIVLTEGERGTSLYVILKGLVRGYYIDEAGNDITKCFASETGFFGTEGLRLDSPSSFTIDCLEDCQCIRIPYAWLKELMGANLPVNDKIRQLFQEEVSIQERRSHNLLLLNAEERYLDFCATFPNLKDRVPLYCIASYIGIHSGSLSRIRKKLHLT